MNHLIISFMTADRPGIVKVLSDLISEHKANWEKSSLALKCKLNMYSKKFPHLKPYSF